MNALRPQRSRFANPSLYSLWGVFQGKRCLEKNIRSCKDSLQGIIPPLTSLTVLHFENRLFFFTELMYPIPILCLYSINAIISSWVGYQQRLLWYPELLQLKHHSLVASVMSSLKKTLSTSIVSSIILELKWIPVLLKPLSLEHPWVQMLQQVCILYSVDRQWRLGQHAFFKVLIGFQLVDLTVTELKNHTTC